MFSLHCVINLAAPVNFLTTSDVMLMQIYKAVKMQTLGVAVLSKCVFTNRRNFRRVCPESRIDGEVGCSTDAVQQQ